MTPEEKRAKDQFIKDLEQLRKDHDKLQEQLDADKKEMIAYSRLRCEKMLAETQKQAWRLKIPDITVIPGGSRRRPGRPSKPKLKRVV